MNFNEVKAEYWDKLKMYVPIVDRVHGNSHPEFHEVKRVFDTLSDKLSRDDDVTSEFEELRGITSDYTVPSDTCESYEAVYHMLRDLDQAYNQ